MMILPLILSVSLYAKTLTTPEKVSKIFSHSQYAHYGLDQDFDLEINLKEIEQKSGDFITIPGEFTEFQATGRLQHSHIVAFDKKLVVKAYMILGRTKGDQLTIEQALFYFCEPARPGNCEDVERKLEINNKHQTLKDRMSMNYLEFSRFTTAQDQFKSQVINYFGLEYPFQTKR